MTEGHLGAKLGVGASVVRTWEVGIAQPNADQLERLTVILGRSAVTQRFQTLFLARRVDAMH